MIGDGISADGIAFWLALWRVHGVGSRFFRRVLKQFGTPDRVFELDTAKLVKFGFSDKAIAQIRNYSESKTDPVSIGVERDLTWLEGDNNHVLTWQDCRYPQLLKTVYDAPPLLFVKGSPSYLQDVQIAIVGSRHPSRQGIENARAFSSHLVDRGLTPTSGLALGIDGAAHLAAVEKGQPTVAVLGNGLDIIYPKSHASLAAKIAETGAIVSEFGTGTAPQASHFPRRNRIISGLSVGVLVVEAALKSGSLITARLALEQGREVFAVPGSIHNPMAKGCHTLIREGAKLVETAEHIVEEVQSLVHLQRENLVANLPLGDEPLTEQMSLINEETNAFEDLSSAEQLVVKCLSFEPIPLDIIAGKTGIDAKELASLLVMLEIQGHVTAQPGGYTLALGWEKQRSQVWSTDEWNTIIKFSK